MLRATSYEGTAFVNVFLVVPYFFCPGSNKNGIVTAVLGRKQSTQRLTVNWFGWGFFTTAQTTLSRLCLDGNCRSQLVWLGFLHHSTDHIVTAVLGRKQSTQRLTVNWFGWGFFTTAQTTLSRLCLEGKCHSQLVWLGFLHHSTDHIVTAVLGRKVSQSTGLAGVSSPQHRPHCHGCAWKESVTVNWFGWGFFTTAQTTLSRLCLEGKCHSQLVWLGFLHHSTDHIVTAVLGRKVSQSTGLDGVSSPQHRPHCHGCAWMETVAVNWFGWGFFTTAQTTLSRLCLEGKCHSQLVYLGFLHHSTDPKAQ